ncbi:MAG: hypothetical protein AAFR47_19555 [Pseudomonadota bacterium]
MLRYLRSGEGLTLAALALIATLLFAVPLGLLFRVGLGGDAGLTLAPLLDALESRSVLRALWNSLESSLLSAALRSLAARSPR